jgi:hypothetical protein
VFNNVSEKSNAPVFMVELLGYSGLHIEKHSSSSFMKTGVTDCVRYEVFTAVAMKNGAFWDVTPCGSCKN